MRVFQIILAAALALGAVGARAALPTQEEALGALEQSNRAIAAAPKQAASYVRRGDIYYLLNDMHRAVADYTTAIQLDDRQDNAWFGRGMAYGRMGLVDEGIADLSVYIARNPDSSVAYTKRGVRNIWRNNLAEAERDLARAVELDPDNAEAHDDLGVVHAKHKRLDVAARHFATAIRLDPSYQKAYHNLAITWFMAGKPRQALQVVDAGLELDADNRSSLMLKAAILQALGRAEEAREISGRAEFLPEDNWTERSAVGGASQ